ncbi:hypothetical protein HHK36_022775 [Tetracentron sinense]|uniref:Uncharacterized GPI-anchored protein At5g19230-like domain-containing protein n=1 Tax=Tetracentron sinense TaxID=13715 RepID=A0A835D6E4_TETSI|nr:hypothetical protein HHK36_022775 [Tetracentron sinense]
MASLRLYLLLFVLLQLILLLSHPVKCDDEKDNILQGINTYRANLNLSALTHNDNAECLADEIADQFKNQPCTNTTGANTVPGTEPQFSSYPALLAKCHLNITNTRDGVILPVCVPNLVPSLVLSNFTESQYSRYFNNTQYTGAGIGSEDNWMVAILTTNTSEGSFVTANGASSENGANFVSKFGLTYHLFLLLGFFLVLVN